MYILLSGYPPFIGSTQESVFDSIQNANYSLNSIEWSKVSLSAKDLISKLIEKGLYLFYII